MDEQVVATVEEEVLKEPPKCNRHPLHLLPCPICAQEEIDGKALAMTRRTMRAKRTYEWNKTGFEKANQNLSDRLRKQGYYVDKRTAWVKMEKERLAEERAKNENTTQSR